MHPACRTSAADGKLRTVGPTINEPVVHHGGHDTDFGEFHEVHSEGVFCQNDEISELSFLNGAYKVIQMFFVGGVDSDAAQGPQQINHWS